MAYSTTLPPQKLAAGTGASMQLWGYTSADTLATVVGAAYISNGSQLGMRVGDAVLVRDTTTPASGIRFVSAVVKDGAATLVAGA
ncbi:hypothetical protein [Neorhizobium sp. AL 9.2.2]|uniref:hypothetical protein n=1 Tax=Neorhizobium sp. AL 9.2.2 TaxID=2712894 RepID=UPI0015749AE2|nr:hypothetical protein [Neorhizobium sp. AL 9.2.2]NSY17261.1 hypothetical protein [Neorhizobium sp. AL 9.2.2]